MQWFWWRLSLFALIFLRLWWVCIWKCLRERGVCEHGRVIQLFLQSSVGSRQHTATLHWSQHHRGCDTHTQTDSIFSFWQFILLGYSKKKYNLVSWLLKWYFSDSLIFSLKPFSLYIPEVVDSEDDVHVDICWQQLEGDNMCAKPLSDRRTTYTECCCLHGVAWSEHCALCPRKDSGEKQESDKIVIF